MDHDSPSTKAGDPARPPVTAQASARSWLRRPGIWAAIALLIVAAAAGWYGWQRRGGSEPARAAEQRQPAKVPVQVVEAGRTDVPVFFDGLGTVQAFNTVTVRSRVDGEIVTVAFTEGQMVKAGDLLAEIDPRPYRAALDQAVAKKAQDEATLASNRQDLARTRQLASREFATQQQLDQQSASVGAASAQIAADQAAIDLARTQLDYATIRAPIAGRTGLRLVDRGNVVRSADTTGIVEIAQIQPIAVIFAAPEQQLPEIAQAMRAGEVAVSALGSDGKTPLAQGKLVLINNQVDQASGTVRLKAEFANAEERLWPGLSVNTRLLVRTLRGAVTMPEEALQRGQNELFAFVVGPDNKAEKRTLRVGAFSGGQVVIEDGLKPGDRVVTAGQSRLQPGSPVEIERAPDGPGPRPVRESRAGSTGDTGSTGGAGSAGGTASGGTGPSGRTAPASH
jgi:multidrug efflux system membrane fusion protein